MQQRSEANEIVPISTARDLSLGWYFTGKPCANGHVAKRSISNRECRKCVDDKRIRQRQLDPEKVRASDRARHANRRDIRNSQSRESRARHCEKRRQENRARYHNDPASKARHIAQATRWSKANPGRRNEIIAARRAHIKRATPLWLTADDKREIIEIYRKARSYGPGVMHVDHEIPLRGKLVCGLHVPSNLRIIPRLVNIRKGNRHGAK
jgi:hypothetical protein